MYLSAEQIAQLAGVDKIHYLNPAAVRNNKSLGDATGLRNIGVHLITVQPGHFSTEYHVHLYEEECIYVLSGSGIATVGEDKFKVGPGDFLSCPAGGEPHDMFSDGDEPLVCLVMGQRLYFDVCDYPRKGKRLYRHGGEWNLVDSHDIERLAR